MERLEETLKKYKSIIILTVILAFVGALCYLYRYEIEYVFSLLKNQDQFKEYLLSFGPLAIVVFGIMQVLQVVIFFIPGEVIQAVGGYAFGTWQATLVSIIGIDMGATILFLVTKKYRSKLVNKVVPVKIKNSLEKTLNSKKLNLVVFLLYLLPGMPKDAMIFLCALSEISFKDYMLYSTLGRIPALTLSCYYGHNIALGNKSIVLIATIIIVVIVLIGIFFKDSILKNIEKVN
ncbi:TVP38/TMEM64 family protein [Clostridium rectalis]|uniref:TVP38/TMEM64 family protein n=1 Tax=Clostridium rectalis TaxID=2040295 RepID=UPI000F633DD7|nr:TVP38/TMEM64 family protein [Clostridium rectalis]